MAPRRSSSVGRKAATTSAAAAAAATTTTTGGMWAAPHVGESKGLLPGRATVGPLLLMLVTPVVALALTHVVVRLGGDYAAFWALLLADPAGTLLSLPVWPSAAALRALGAWWAFQLALMRLVPGPEYRGPVTPAGNVPVYTANGFACFLITLATWLFGSFVAGWWSPTAVWDLFPEIATALNAFALLLCVFLYFKGLVAPSSTDAGASGNLVADVFWGTELYPRVLGWDVKLFTNCRHGMMAWAMLPLVAVAKSLELHGGVLDPGIAVSAALQLAYCCKFFLWETGYLASMDIAHDRAGYYLCWGCLVWVPTFYTSHTLAMVNNPVGSVSNGPALFFFALGVASIFCNYDADRQRVLVRETRGACKIWGRTPDIINASYKTTNGETRTSILLVSGWWAVSRHVHYLPEVLAAVCWSACGGLQSPGRLAYPIFLAVLLVDRSFRDDSRCAEKYGASWTEYCRRVPYKIVPGLL